MDLLNLFDFEREATARLAAPAFGYYAGGAADEITVKDNHAAYSRLRLRPRVMVDVKTRDSSTQLFGHILAMPALVAPMAFQALAHPDGELATARAAAAAGIPMVLSSLSTTAMEDVVAASLAPVWFQLYIFRDRAITKALVERAERAGCKALVVTVDAPLQGKRERDVRNNFHLPEGVEMRNLLPAGKSQFPVTDSGSALAAFIHQHFEPSLVWRDIEWLRSVTTLPVIVKGILRGDDAARAVASGAEGVIVSNHGGRQLDTALASIDALPDVMTTVGGTVPVLIDGGIRRGTDVLKALALGANAVLVGRPVLWGLAVNGEHGAAQVLAIIKDEFDVAMGLCGCRTVGEITPDLVAR